MEVETLVGCGQISLAFYSKANGLNEVIFFTGMVDCCAKQVDTTERCPKIDLFTFKGY